MIRLLALVPQCKLQAIGSEVVLSGPLVGSGVLLRAWFLVWKEKLKRKKYQKVTAFQQMHTSMPLLAECNAAWKENSSGGLAFRPLSKI